MSLWRSFWAFIDGLSNPAIGVVCVLLVASYAVREKAAPILSGSEFSAVQKSFSLQMVRGFSRISLSRLRLGDLCK
jgi:hypothetical protein